MNALVLFGSVLAFVAVLGIWGTFELLNEWDTDGALLSGLLTLIIGAIAGGLLWLGITLHA